MRFPHQFKYKSKKTDNQINSLGMQKLNELKDRDSGI